MSKEAKEVNKTDLISLEQYSKNRKQLRKNLIKFKKNRKIPLGPCATFYFECYETILGQIQEMLYIEKGGENQLKDELKAYGPLIPKGKELVATLMFEIDNPVSRTAFLNKVGGIEKKIYLKVDFEKIYSVPEQDLDRTSAAGKASSVQFIHFNFNEEQIKKFKDNNFEIIIGIDHKEYSHFTKIPKNIRIALSNDFF